MRIHGAVLILLLAGSSVLAQDWAKEMFDHTEYNFGTVASGAKAEHRFTIENIYLEDAHIDWVLSTCNCTRPSVTKQSLKTWEKSQIVATIDTQNFRGQREAAIKVHFDRPFDREVILRVACYIRGDVVVQPGAIDFGAIAQGSRVVRRATISYAGRPDWRIQAIETSNRNLDIYAVESGRNFGQVTYDLTVTLKESAPHGYLKDQLTLVTNDANFRTARVPIPIEGIITAPISVRPLPLLLGAVPAGQSITRPLVMQSITPFKVIRVQCSDPRFQFRLPATVQSVQLIPVTFAAGDVPGNVDQVIHIETDASSAAAVDVPVQARVIAPPTTVREESGEPGKAGGNSGAVLGARNDSGWGPSHDEPGPRPSGTAADAPLPAPRVQSPVPATRGAPVVESPATGKKGAAEADRSSPGLTAGKWYSSGLQTLPPGARPSAAVPPVAPAAINPPYANPAPANNPAPSGTPNAPGAKHPPLPWDGSSSQSP